MQSQWGWQVLANSGMLLCQRIKDQPGPLALSLVLLQHPAASQ